MRAIFTTWLNSFGSGFRVVAFDSRGRGRSDRAREAAEYTVLTEAGMCCPG